MIGTLKRSLPLWLLCATLAAGAQAEYPQQVYWGDTHLHTNYSADAYGLGNRLTPEHAYAFARGERLQSNSGQEVQLGRPLEFLAVTDHAEYLGVSALLDGDPARLAGSEIGKRWLDAQGNSKEQVFDLAIASKDQGDRLRATWQDPAFDPTQPAFYYARVLEAPTPRWTRHDEQRFGVSPPAGTPRMHQERAYTSPIWYAPRTGESRDRE